MQNPARQTALSCLEFFFPWSGEPHEDYKGLFELLSCTQNVGVSTMEEATCCVKPREVCSELYQTKLASLFKEISHVK